MGVVLSCDMTCDSGASERAVPRATAATAAAEKQSRAINDNDLSNVSRNKPTENGSGSSEDGASDSSDRTSHAGLGGAEDDRCTASVLLQLTCAIPKIESSTRASRFTAHCAEAAVSLAETLQRVAAQCWAVDEENPTDVAPGSASFAYATASKASTSHTGPSGAASHAGAGRERPGIKSLPFRVRCCLLQGKLYRCFFSQSPASNGVAPLAATTTESATVGAEQAVLLVGGELLERAKKILTDAERHWRELVAAAAASTRACSPPCRSQQPPSPREACSTFSRQEGHVTVTTATTRSSASFVVCEESLARFLELFSSEMELLPCVTSSTNSPTETSPTENSFQFVAMQRLSGSADKQQHSMHRLSGVIDRELLRPEATRRLVGLAAVWDGLLRFLTSGESPEDEPQQTDAFDSTSFASTTRHCDPAVSSECRPLLGSYPRANHPGGSVSVALIRGDPLSGKSSVLTECHTRLALLPCVLVDGQACGRTIAVMPTAVSPPSGNAVDDAVLCASPVAVVAPLLFAIYSQFELQAQRRTGNLQCCGGTTRTSSSSLPASHNKPQSVHACNESSNNDDDGVGPTTVGEAVEGLKNCLTRLRDDHTFSSEGGAPPARSGLRVYVLIDDAHLILGDHVSLELLDVLVAQPISIDIAVVASTSLEVPPQLRMQLSDQRVSARPALLTWTVVLPTTLASLTPAAAANHAASALIRQHVATTAGLPSSPMLITHTSRQPDDDVDAGADDAAAADSLWVSAVRAASGDSITTVAMLSRTLRNNHPATKSLQHVMHRSHGLTRFIREHYVTLRLQDVLLQHGGECATLAERLTDAVSLLLPTELEWLARLVCYALATNSPRVPLPTADALLRLNMMHPASLSPSHSDEGLAASAAPSVPGRGHARHRLIQALHHVAVCDGRGNETIPSEAATVSSQPEVVDQRQRALRTLNVPPPPAELLPFHRPALANLMFYATGCADSGNIPLEDASSSLQFVFPASPAMLWKQLPAALRREACELVSLSSVADGMQTSAKLWLTCAIGSLEDRGLLSEVEAELRHLPPTNSLFFAPVVIDSDPSGVRSVASRNNTGAVECERAHTSTDSSEALRILTVLAEHGYGHSGALADHSQPQQQQYRHQVVPERPRLDPELDKFSSGCPALQRYLEALDRIRRVSQQTRSKKKSSHRLFADSDVPVVRESGCGTDPAGGVASITVDGGGTLHDQRGELVSDGHASAGQRASEASSDPHPTPLMVSVPNCIPDVNVVLQLTLKAWVAVDAAAREHRHWESQPQSTLLNPSFQKADATWERNLTISSAGSDASKSPYVHVSSPPLPPTPTPTPTTSTSTAAVAAVVSTPHEADPHHTHHPLASEALSCDREAPSTLHDTVAVGDAPCRSRSTCGSLMDSFVTPMTATSFTTMMSPASEPMNSTDAYVESDRNHGVAASTFPDVALPPCTARHLHHHDSALAAAAEVLSSTWSLCRQQIGHFASHPVDISRLSVSTDGALLLDTVHLATQRVDALVDAVVKHPAAVVAWKDAFQDLCQVCATASNALVRQLGKVSRRTTVERIERSILRVPCSLFQNHLRILLAILSHLLEVRETVDADESLTRTQRVVRLQLAASTNVRLCLSQATSICAETVSLMRQVGVAPDPSGDACAPDVAGLSADDLRRRRRGWHKVYRLTMHSVLTSLCALDAHVRSNCSAIAEDLLTHLMSLLTFTANGPLTDFAVQLRERFGDVASRQLCTSHLCRRHVRPTTTEGDSRLDGDVRWKVAIPPSPALPIPVDSTTVGLPPPPTQQLRSTATGWKPKRKMGTCPPPQ